MDEYRTIELAAQDEFTEKRSRFIGFIKPVKTADDAVGFINEIKRQNWDAKHNVYAYSLRDGQQCRYSDDGEPKGTAGVPVLDVLQKEKLVDCAVVVTRYFGGVLLGTGGLVRAYSHAAKLAVDAGGIITMKKCALCELRCDYNQYAKADSLLKNGGCFIKDALFESDVCIKFAVPETILHAIDADITDTFCGTVKIRRTGEEFAPFKE